MESSNNDDRQNDDSRNDTPTQESRDVVHDEVSTEVTSQRNNPGAASGHFSEDVSVRLNSDRIRSLCERNEELEKRNEELEERIRELEIKQRLDNDTVHTLTNQVHNLTTDNARLQEENVQLENTLIEQKQYTVPTLDDLKKREELRIYFLNSGESEFPYYVIHRQKATIEEADRKLRDKYPLSEKKSSAILPNATNAYNYITQECGIIRFKNYFKCVGTFEELLTEIDELFYETYGKILTRH